MGCSKWARSNPFQATANLVDIIGYTLEHCCLVMELSPLPLATGLVCLFKSRLSSDTHKSFFLLVKPNQSNWSYNNSYLAFLFSLVLAFSKATPSTLRAQLAVVQALYWYSAHCLSSTARRQSFPKQPHQASSDLR